MSKILETFTLDRSWRWFRFRGLVLALVFSMGLTAFWAGVGVTDREDVATADFMTKIYYTLGLFVLGGLDLGVPRDGPLWAQVLLWLAYFGAPAITTSALVEGVLRAIRPDAFRLRLMRGHLVIGGCGRLTMLYLKRFRQANPRQPVLVVDNRPDNPNIQVAVKSYRANALFGDVSSEAILASLRLHRARSVVLLTGNDYVNLDAASRICQMAPQLAGATVVHVADIRLLRMLEQSQILNQAAKFNSYRSAAQYLVEQQLRPHFHDTESCDTVVLAGFGRFGQTVLDELQRQASGQFSMVVLVDLRVDLLSTVFAEQVGFKENYRYELLSEDLRHPRTWHTIDDLIGGQEQRPVFVLGSGDDGVNIRTALWLSARFSDAKIVARCFHHSSFTAQISKECRFDIVSTADMLLASLHPEWFGK